ncbi:hypothetical protein ABT294_30815 [Nonomuraea sp. NPDC000554]|uniref:hypothetical protein n=1 Tax=Nonomuraea sp. NPDC000554 TaxID=3154259 RepID=UPI003332D3D4
MLSVRRFLPTALLVAALALVADSAPVPAHRPASALPTGISEAWSFASKGLGRSMDARPAMVVGAEVILPSGPTPSLSGDLEVHDVSTGRTRLWREDFLLGDDVSVVVGDILVSAGNRGGPGVVTGFELGKDRHLWTRELAEHADGMVVADRKAILVVGPTVLALLPDSGAVAWEKTLRRDCYYAADSWGRLVTLSEMCTNEPGSRSLVLDASSGAQVLDERVADGKDPSLRAALGELVLRESPGGLEYVGAGGAVRHRVPGSGIEVEQVIQGPRGSGMVIASADGGRSAMAYDEAAHLLWKRPGLPDVWGPEREPLVSADRRFAYSLLNPKADEGDALVFLDVRSLADGRRAIFPLPLHGLGASILGVSGNSVVIRATGADGPAVTVFRLEGADQAGESIEVHGTRFAAWPDPCSLLPPDTLPAGGKGYDHRPETEFGRPAVCTLIPSDEHDPVLRVAIAWMADTPGFAGRLLAAARFDDEQNDPAEHGLRALGGGAYLRAHENGHGHQDLALVVVGRLVVSLQAVDDERATVKYAKVLAAHLHNR